MMRRAGKFSRVVEETEPLETLETQSPETLQPIDPPPTPEPELKKTTFTQAELHTYDFTGWDWRELPLGVVKAARNGGSFTVTKKIDCVNCWRQMWTSDPQKDDLCEECDYFLRDRIWKMRGDYAKRQNLKPVNPWHDNDRPNPNFWPKG
jgi:hypothetical protein